MIRHKTFRKPIIYQYFTFFRCSRLPIRLRHQNNRKRKSRRVHCSVELSESQYFRVTSSKAGQYRCFHIASVGYTWPRSSSKKKGHCFFLCQDAEINVLVPSKVFTSVNMYGLTFARTNSRRPRLLHTCKNVCGMPVLPYEGRTWLENMDVPVKNIPAWFCSR